MPYALYTVQKGKVS